jgi:hypothetical protein
MSGSRGSSSFLHPLRNQNRTPVLDLEGYWIVRGYLPGVRHLQRRCLSRMEDLHGLLELRLQKTSESKTAVIGQRFRYLHTLSWVSQFTPTMAAC